VAVIAELRKDGDLSPTTRQHLAAKAFSHTAAYDAAISGWLSGQGEPDGYPRSLSLVLEKAYGLRYGENPHQSGAFYRDRNAPAGSLARSESLGTGAKELSFNNLVDVEAALDAVREFETPAAVVVKHTSPCGVAVAQTLVEAYRLAREADSLSAFGGIVALNREVDIATAVVLSETFIECVVAPRFAADALEKLRAKKNLRLLATGEWLSANHPGRHMKRVGGGFVIQARDAQGPGEVLQGKVVTKRAPTDAELAALDFAWCACKHVKSNAITFARPGALPDSYVTTGIGGGQTSRVGAVGIAVKNAGDAARGSVMASDAFFPFRDGLDAAVSAGVTAVAQPGGSKGDDEVIAAADESGIAMVFTSVRHFRH
jgi:phosphoribosylaminoimidazolecarboxamide formyltransferase/IMP cyclohydrolase